MRKVCYNQYMAEGSKSAERYLKEGFKNKGGKG